MLRRFPSQFLKRKFTLSHQLSIPKGGNSSGPNNAHKRPDSATGNFNYLLFGSDRDATYTTDIKKNKEGRILVKKVPNMGQRRTVSTAKDEAELKYMIKHERLTLKNNPELDQYQRLVPILLGTPGTFQEVIRQTLGDYEPLTHLRHMIRFYDSTDNDMVDLVLAVWESDNLLFDHCVYEAHRTILVQECFHVLKVRPDKEGFNRLKNIFKKFLMVQVDQKSRKFSMDAKGCATFQDLFPVQDEEVKLEIVKSLYSDTVGVNYALTNPVGSHTFCVICESVPNIDHLQNVIKTMYSNLRNVCISGPAQRALCATLRRMPPNSKNFKAFFNQINNLVPELIHDENAVHVLRTFLEHSDSTLQAQMIESLDTYKKKRLPFGMEEVIESTKDKLKLSVEANRLNWDNVTLDFDQGIRNIVGNFKYATVSERQKLFDLINNTDCLEMTTRIMNNTEFWRPLFEVVTEREWSKLEPYFNNCNKNIKLLTHEQLINLANLEMDQPRIIQYMIQSDDDAEIMFRACIKHENKWTDAAGTHFYGVQFFLRKMVEDYGHNYQGYIERIVGKIVDPHGTFRNESQWINTPIQVGNNLEIAKNILTSFCERGVQFNELLLGNNIGAVCINSALIAVHESEEIDDDEKAQIVEQVLYNLIPIFTQICSTFGGSRLISDIIARAKSESTFRLLIQGFRPGFENMTYTSQVQFPFCDLLRNIPEAWVDEIIKNMNKMIISDEKVFGRTIRHETGSYTIKTLLSRTESDVILQAIEKQVHKNFEQTIFDEYAKKLITHMVIVHENYRERLLSKMVKDVNISNQAFYKQLAFSNVSSGTIVLMITEAKNEKFMNLWGKVINSNLHEFIVHPCASYVVQAYLKRYGSKSELGKISYPFENMVSKLIKFDVFQDDVLLSDFYMNATTSPIIQWSMKCTRNQEFRDLNNKFILKYYDQLAKHDQGNFCITVAIEGDYYYGDMSLIKKLSKKFYNDIHYFRYNTRFSPRVFCILKLCDANPKFFEFAKNEMFKNGSHPHPIFLEEVNRIDSGDRALESRIQGQRSIRDKNLDPIHGLMSVLEKRKGNDDGKRKYKKTYENKFDF